MVRNRVRNEWSARRTRASDLAESLAVRISGTRLPTALAAIARERLVHKIQFEPLLIDGSITPDDEGFVISLKCDESEIREFTAQLHTDDTAKNLPWRTRFTLAHEIAHTFFFDVNSLPPRTKVDFANSQTAKSLERSCHRAALQLLLPEMTFATRYRTTDFLQPKSLRQICFDAAMSAPAVIMRFRFLRRLTHPFGILVAVEQWSDGLFISCVSRHSALKNVFKGIGPGQPLKKAIPEREFVLNGGSKSEIAIQDVHVGQKRFIVRAERRSRTGIGALFVTLQPELQI
jgi:hypothetical protein